ncbi:hypothetical protein [Enterobacter roggenkampii]|uniref:hypothetical protein n=1 Tax=Enterobacter roggenkampii TaxID=1812935 RepID=UPI00084CB959|nr:hypothetical protein [Enterobacter roggenkampii]AOP95943.1 hypothetical protein BFV67_12295 [Enterobacter roggenkampii]QWZ74006.1 hypothetical protein I6L60_05120 [Enterobacter roggenkampii]
MNIENQHLQDLSLEAFLKRNNLSEEEFTTSKMDWSDLLSIGVRHAEKTPYLKETAALLSNLLQQGDNVHSVRWRIKDPEHLMAKIIRKRNENINVDDNKYMDVSVENYHEKITDLIGIRVLHLFKKEWISIHQYITSMWRLLEKPIVYIRDGDDSELDVYRDGECEVKIHKAGYRSVHYVITTRPLKEEISSEIQVRTIFEEGWSEIDHQVKYPNYSNNELIKYFLMIFNRFAGSADEMGSFVLDLRQATEIMDLSRAELLKMEGEKQESLDKINQLVAQLSLEETEAGKRTDELKQLKSELERLKQTEKTIQVHSDTTVGGQITGNATFGRLIGNLNTVNAITGSVQNYVNPNALTTMQNIINSSSLAAMRNIINSSSLNAIQNIANVSNLASIGPYENYRSLLSKQNNDFITAKEIKSNDEDIKETPNDNDVNKIVTNNKNPSSDEEPLN